MKACNENCKTCNGKTKENCTSCNTGKYYLRGLCLSECPSQYPLLNSACSYTYETTCKKCLDCT